MDDRPPTVLRIAGATFVPAEAWRALGAARYRSCRHHGKRRQVDAALNAHSVVTLGSDLQCAARFGGLPFQFVEYRRDDVSFGGHIWLFLC
jgi:hypothetical protein